MLIAAARLVTAMPGTGILAPGWLAVSGGRVTAVGPGRPARRPDVKLASGVLAPGFVDLQVNGYVGAEFADPDPVGWALAVRRLTETGTTAFLPTVITAPADRMAASLRGAAALLPDLPAGAKVLGLHVEGPFISPLRRGAHNPGWMSDPSPAAVQDLLAAGSGQIRVVTLAAERPGALAATASLAAAGAVVSIGHSDATAAQVAAAADAGARMVTHLFNAQRPLGHREPGVPGQALADPRLTSSLIADFRHVAAAVCALAFAAAPGRICLISDASAAAGMPPGSYLLGGEQIVLPPGEGAPPMRADGTLAGSALRLDTAVANMAAAGVGVADAIAAATRIPADLLNCTDIGRIAPGAAADLTWLDDDLRALATWVDGNVVYSATRVGPALAGEQGVSVQISGGHPPDRTAPGGNPRPAAQGQPQPEPTAEDRRPQPTAEDHRPQPAAQGYHRPQRTAPGDKPQAAAQGYHHPQRTAPGDKPRAAAQGHRPQATRMRAEIGEQPGALAATLDALLPRTAEIARLAAATRQVLLIARGTSDNAAVYGSYLLQVHAGRLATLASPSVATSYRSRVDLSGVLAVALSQSGRTTEIVETLAWAAAQGARTLAITNGAGSPLAQTAELALITVAGAEQAVPATKTFITQLAALAVLCIGLGADLDPADLRRVPDEVERMIAEPGDVEAAAAALAGAAGLVVSGRGLVYGTALELALKLKEACYLHAMGLSYADLLHGPIAVVDADTPAIIMAADTGPALDGAVSLARRVAQTGALALGIGGGTALARECRVFLPGPRLPEWLAPIGLIVPGQLLTEALARRLGLDPDSPRGLSKVTQTG